MPYVLVVTRPTTPDLRKDFTWGLDKLPAGAPGQGDEDSLKHGMEVAARESLRFFVVPPAGEGEKGFSPVVSLGRTAKTQLNVPGKLRAKSLSKRHLSLRVGGDGVSLA